MRILFFVVFNLLSIQMFAQTPTRPCNPGDPDGKPGCPTGNCGPDGQDPDISIPVIRAVDPNEIIGMAGYESQQWLAAKQTQEYKVLFENDPEFATAPAQNVTIYVPIHAKLNPASLRISDFGFGSFNFSVPANLSTYTNRLDVRDSLGIFVDITAGLDVANRRAFWIFQSIDPATGLAATLPANSGFLPVNDSTIHNGEGYVTFTLRPSSQAVTKDTISASASIIFDSEETIETNVWKNTLDGAAPVSSMKSLPAIHDKPTFDISWEGQDDADGSGLKSFAIYVSENSGPFTLLKQGIVSTTMQFTGNYGSQYCFNVIAIDNVGNQESAKNICEATISVSHNPLPVTWIYFKGQLVTEGALLKWATTSELNAERFVVQRSFDARMFSDIGELPASGFSSDTRNYHFTDSEILTHQGKTAYYRLMQLDFDGKTTYSTIIAVKIIKMEPEISVKAYPNPFLEQITIEILNVTTSHESDQVSIYSKSGTKLYSRKLKNFSGSSVLLSDLPTMLPGVYLLTTSISGKLYTIRMIKH